MKIGLIGLNSQFVHSALALYYLRECAPNFCQCTIKEYSVNDPILTIFYDLVATDWDVLAFSVYIWNREPARKLIDLLRQVRPNTVIVVGGPEPTYSPEAFSQAHYIVYGALEATWPQLLESLAANQVPSLPGLSGAVQFAPEWPFPYRESDLTGLQHRLVYYETSRGCPYKCGFCLSAAEKGVAYLPLERVKDELDFFLNAHIPVVKLVDRTFNQPPERAKEIMAYLLSRPNQGTTFHFELKGEVIDGEMLELFRKSPPGLFQVEIGIQTLNQQALAACGRTNKWPETKALYHELGELENVHTHFDLIAALPYEDYQSFQYTFSEAMTIIPSHMQLGFLKLLPGAPLEKVKANHGYIAQEYPPYEVVGNKYISCQELAELKKIDQFLDVYYNKGRYPNLMRFAMDKWTQPLFELFHGLAQGQGEPAATLTELMPEAAAVWQSLARFDTFMAGRKIKVQEREEKKLRRLLNNHSQVEELLPHYAAMPYREIYKRLRLGIFPVTLRAEGQRLIEVKTQGETAVLFDYKVKTNKKSESENTDFYILEFQD